MVDIFAVADATTFGAYALTYGFRGFIGLLCGGVAYCGIRVYQELGRKSATIAPVTPSLEANTPASTSPLLAVAEPLETSIKEIVNVRPADIQRLTVQRHEIDAKPLKGSGAEGEFRLASAGDGWKIFFNPRDQFDGTGAEQAEKRRAAERKHEELALRLEQLPHRDFSSPWMVLPTGALKIKGEPEPVGGIVMPFIDGAPFSDFCTPKGQRRSKVSRRRLAAVFLQLYDQLEWAHSQGWVGLDLKAENLRVRGDHLFQLDLDGAGFAQFKPMAATAELYPPEMCDSKGAPLVTPNRVSDWYAFLVLLCQACTGEHPAGGIHRPQAGSGVPQLDGGYQRLKSRVSIFNRDVDLPRETRRAIWWLPSDLRKLFGSVFEDGQRGKPVRALIARLGTPWWKRLFTSGEQSLESQLQASCWANGHTLQSPRAAWLKSTKIKALYTGRGEILAGKMMPSSRGLSTPAILVREGSDIITNEGTHWFSNTLKSAFVLLGDSLKTDLVKGGPDVMPRSMATSPLVTSTVSGKPTVEVFLRTSTNDGIRLSQVAQLRNGLPAVVMQGGTPFWMHGGTLLRLDKLSKVELATITGEVSLFSGDRFGIATSISESTREITGLFLFDKSGVKRLVGYPPLHGEVTSSECYISQDTAWLFLTARHNGHLMDYVLVLGRSGELLGWVGSPSGAILATHPGIARCVNERDLYAVVGGFVYHLQCVNLTVSVVSVTRVTGVRNPTVIMTDGSTLFGA